jgi:hypothetical protein
MKILQILFFFNFTTHFLYFCFPVLYKCCLFCKFFRKSYHFLYLYIILQEILQKAKGISAKIFHLVFTTAHLKVLNFKQSIKGDYGARDGLDTALRSCKCLSIG